MTSKSNIIWTAGLVALVLPLAGCPEKRDAKHTEKPRSVLLIIVDTLRVDKLGCYGSDLGATPRIDELAGAGVRFERAYSHAPWTLPACASILTSLYPSQHTAGGQMNAHRILPDAIRTVPECFRDAGFATGAVINVDFLTEAFGMTQGFDHVDFEVYPDNVRMRPATKTTEAALGWLTSRQHERFFLMVHYFDPHLVYAPPGEYRRRFAAPEDRDDDKWVFGTRRQIRAHRQGLLQFDEPTVRRAERLYSGEVAYTDHEVGRLLDGLERLGLADSTIVALTADHGEEFLDHGGLEHGHTLYDELVQVPLIIRGEEGTKGRSVASLVGLVDLAPTLCELAGVEPGPDFVGRSLLGPMHGTHDDDHPVVLEGIFFGTPQRGWLKDGYKLVLFADGMATLFNLVDDPQEKNDLRKTEPERVKRMTEDLKQTYTRMMNHMQVQVEPVKLSPEAAQRLRSLGYTGD